MVGWLDGWTDGRRDGWMDGWVGRVRRVFKMSAETSNLSSCILLCCRVVEGFYTRACVNASQNNPPLFLSPSLPPSLPLCSTHVEKLV